MSLRRLFLRLAGHRGRPDVEVMETLGGAPIVVSDEPDAVREARRLLLDPDLAADFSIGIAPKVHPAVLAAMERLVEADEAY